MRKYFLMIAVLIFAVIGCAGGPHFNPRNPQERAKMVDVYLADFCSPTLRDTQVGGAIREVMMRLPPEALMKVMDRRRPVLFTEVFDVGTAKFASSSEIIVGKRDVPAFQEGMTILKLSTALNAGSKQAAMGIVAHELAHRVLDHVRRGETTCKAEREANRLVKTWGFVEEYKSASSTFGQEKTGDHVASCQENK